jgi:hypothetical protein
MFSPIQAWSITAILTCLVFTLNCLEGMQLSLLVTNASKSLQNMNEEDEQQKFKWIF